MIMQPANMSSVSNVVAYAAMQMIAPSQLLALTWMKLKVNWKKITTLLQIL
jgi:hypothetical protein